MGLLRGVARTAMIAGTATAVSNRVSRRQAGRWARQEEADAYEQQPPPEPPADDPQARMAALQQLGELKAQGVLSEAEFQQEKSRILQT
ncbi:SHOCT domain-containing protein [Paractinoplanes toevensis]|uniref:SHOCT domain-containing protein n=1 Tax=Paractinoplanes toevensis TaxID=571911 RepID=A0A919W974_9ACTN|nr:SHOCT domain-containing protein [Actinoplanes toevensis]GIM95935.1 hypothetical protein Ato02nite_077280 [Actinoplanes toevensis]